MINAAGVHIPQMRISACLAQRQPFAADVFTPAAKAAVPHPSVRHEKIHPLATMIPMIPFIIPL